MLGIAGRRHLLRAFLRQDVRDHIGTFDARQLRVQPLKLETERIVLDTQLVKHRRMQIMNGRLVLYGRVA